MRSEKGFTLIEMITVVAILGVIMGVMSMTVGMIPKVSGKSNDQAVALRQVQNAGYWISRDAQRAQNIYDDVLPPDFLTFTWTEWDYEDVNGESILHMGTYVLEDMPGGAKKLVRRHWTDDLLDEQLLISEYIDYNPGDGVSTEVISYDSPILKVRITATFGEVTVSREYEASRRPTF